MKLPKSTTLTFISKSRNEKKLTEKQFKVHLRKIKSNITLQQYVKKFLLLNLRITAFKKINLL